MKNTPPFIIRASSLCALMALAPLASGQTPAPAAAPPPPGMPAAEPPADTSVEHTSYLFGLTFGEQMHSVGVSNQVDQEAISRGIKDGLQGKKTTRGDQQQVQGFVRNVMTETLAHNKQAAKDFLEKNAHEKGIKTTEDGLQYRVVSPGNLKAPAVQPTDEATVQYRGKLLDGSEFDSSYSRGVPTTFKVNGVIKGWQEALVLMKPGAKWQLFVPPELAYDTSARPGIPAGSLLVFDVELVSVKPSETPAAAATPPGLPNSHRAAQPIMPPAPPAPPAAPAAPAAPANQ